MKDSTVCQQMTDWTQNNIPTASQLCFNFKHTHTLLMNYIIFFCNLGHLAWLILASTYIIVAIIRSFNFLTEDKLLLPMYKTITEETITTWQTDKRDCEMSKCLRVYNKQCRALWYKELASLIVQYYSNSRGLMGHLNTSWLTRNYTTD